MSESNRPLPEHYGPCIRTLLRFACAMMMFGLLSGVLFQESSKKVTHADAPNGLHWEATYSLAFVHGHAFLIGVLIPVCVAGMLLLAQRVGGRSLSGRSLGWLRRAYLPGAAVAVLLMLYKGYHVLLHLRMTEVRDLDEIDAKLFGGIKALRHGVYGLSHVAMAVGLGVFAVAMWRSLGRGASDGSPR